jgi:phage/plasmid-like protein (TIGR03299 family)
LSGLPGRQAAVPERNRTRALWQGPLYEAILLVALLGTIYSLMIANDFRNASTPYPGGRRLTGNGFRERHLGGLVMAHEVETMAFFGQVPWHGLGTVLNAADQYDWPSAARKAGLDWEVELVPLVTADTQVKVDHRAVRRTSDGRVLGVVGPRYHPLQNTEAFQWFVPFLDAREAQLHTAGSLRNGSRVWVLAKLNRDPLVIATGDEVEKYLLLSHGHDGSLAVRCGFTPIRVVCQNTLSMAYGSDASKLIRIKHTKDVLVNLANVREIMNLANAQFEATAEQYRLLARKSISQSDLRRYVRRMLRIGDEQELSARTRNTLEEIIGLCESGRGNDLPSVRGTLWTAYNGISEWLTHQRGRNVDNRLNSLWFGDAALTNRHALEVALAMAV